MKIKKSLVAMMLLTGSLIADKQEISLLPDWELIEIDKAVKRNAPADNHQDLVKLLIAIRKAENGGEGREFGIMNDKADTYSKQAGWCASTCFKNYIRWLKTDMKKPYLVYLANRYAPVGAANDPDGLNINWLKNVVYWLEVQK